jgi:deoxyribose-phosphate aldolase
MDTNEVRMYAREFAKFIDHTNVKPDALERDIARLCDEAIEYEFASACVSSCWVPMVRQRLRDTDIKTCSVVGFPFGAQILHAKAFETKAAVASGADEIDAVINIGFLLSGRVAQVQAELDELVDAAGDAAVKIIIEACYLSDEQKVLAATLARDAGATFVKTSTGYGTGGAKAEDVELLRKNVHGIKIKASGGVRTFDEAKKLIDSGASRIGASSGPGLMKGLK